MRLAEKLAVAGLIAAGCLHPAAHAAWSGFERPAGHLCVFGSPLRDHHASLVISGRFEAEAGRHGPVFSLVFTADDHSPEITKLDVAVDNREIAHFDVVSHVPAALGVSAVVTLDAETLGTLFRAVDTGKVLHVPVPPARQSYDFDLAGFGTAADVFTDCMLRNN